MAPAPKDTEIDILLVSYLDDELPPELRQKLERRLESDESLRARLNALAEGSQEIRGSFDALLEAAPRARLDAALASALAKAPRRSKSRYREMVLAAAAALLLLIGGVTGYFIAKGPGDFFQEADAFEEQWIAAVSGQLQLYNADSVAAIEVNDSALQADLAKLGDVVKLDLSQQKVAFEGLTLKRAELLHFQGHAVVELLYASEEHGPVAFCITVKPGGESEEEEEVESQDGLNLMYWSDSGRRFLLIGAAPADRIEGLADAASERFRS